MKVLVTGGTGYIGRHFVREMVRRGHDVTVFSRSGKRAVELEWGNDVRHLHGDINHPDCISKSLLRGYDVLAHLAWPGLNNFRELAHFEQYAPASYLFIQHLVQNGCNRVVATGTCLEYGLQQGCLEETLNTSPVVAYALGKDNLRRGLELLRTVTPFHLSWARLFYMHGFGQNPRSLLAQLDQAIDRGDDAFDMSGGEQLRDYLPVVEVARSLAVVAESTSHNGIVNICSGSPVSVRSIVEQHIEQRQASIRLNLGHYPYPDYEPFAFWGNRTTLTSLENSHE